MYFESAPTRTLLVPLWFHLELYLQWVKLPRHIIWHIYFLIIFNFKRNLPTMPFMCFCTPEDIIKTNCENIPLPMDTSTNVVSPLPQDAFKFFFLSGCCRWTGSAPNLGLYLYLSGGVAPWSTLQNFVTNTPVLRKCVSIFSTLVGWQMLSFCETKFAPCCPVMNWMFKGKAISAGIYYLLWADIMFSINKFKFEFLSCDELPCYYIHTDSY